MSSYLGKKLYADCLKKRSVKLLLFKSTFCSKCLINRNKLFRHIQTDIIIEIDISQQHDLSQQIRPTVIPTILLLSSDNMVIYEQEGVISDHELDNLNSIITKVI